MSATFIPTQITWRTCPPVGAGGLGRNAFQYRDALMENICWTRTQGRYLHGCTDRRISLCGRLNTTESSCLRGETGGPGRHLADTFHISLDNYRQTSGTSRSIYNIRTVTYNRYIWTLQSAWRKSCGPGDQNWANRVLLLEGLIVRVGDCHHVTMSFQLTLLNIFVFALNM